MMYTVPVELPGMIKQTLEIAIVDISRLLYRLTTIERYYVVSEAPHYSYDKDEPE
jgi:hypothetical protein